MEIFIFWYLSIFAILYYKYFSHINVSDFFVFFIHNLILCVYG